jgi:hypothetical protein
MELLAEERDSDVLDVLAELERRSEDEPGVDPDAG